MKMTPCRHCGRKRQHVCDSGDPEFGERLWYFAPLPHGRAFIASLQPEYRSEEIRDQRGRVLEESGHIINSHIDIEIRRCIEEQLLSGVVG